MIWVRGRQLAELAEELPEKFLGLPPETMDAAGGGEFAEQLMRNPCGTAALIEFFPFGGAGAVLDDLREKRGPILLESSPLLKIAQQ